MRVALKLNSTEFIDTIMRECKEPDVLKQMGFMIARQGFPYKVRNEELASIINNQKLSELYMLLAKDMQVLEPKTVEQVLKTHLEENVKSALTGAVIDSAKKNLSETYVSALVNLGFGSDALLTTQAATWFPNNKESGRFAAAAGLGLIYLWDPDNGMNYIDKYLYIMDDNIVAGAYMALGLVNCKIKSDFDPALQVLMEPLRHGKDVQKVGAVMGLSFAYAGTCRPEILEALTPLVIDTSYSMELSAMSALSLGIVFSGSCNVDVLNAIMQGITDREATTLENHPLSRYFALALGLVFLGQQEKIDTILEAVKLIPQPLGKFMTATLTFCAYAGTGNVLKVQEMMRGCADHLEAKDALHQIASVLGVAVIALGEEIGMEMAFRAMNHLLQYGEPAIRKTVPLAIGLLSLSNPDIAVMDMLTKLTYDPDKEVARSAIFALGLISAGTNNSRLAEVLRQIASYSHQDNDTMFMVRIAQGLLQMGKGLVSIQPIHSDKFLLSNVALSGILTAVFACTNLPNIMFANYHYLLYSLALAAAPRICMPVPVCLLTRQ
ncbi:MAG: hypothetical protein P4L10_16585 [Acidobacteriaceae bacterium]|nr:hypothetical protein [Acidobacteriaceae bacterium]